MEKEWNLVEYEARGNRGSLFRYENSAGETRDQIRRSDWDVYVQRMLDTDPGLRRA